MTPYFDRDGIAIYHGDCLDVVPRLSVAPALVLTDPPYGMDYKPKRGSDGSKRWQDGVAGDAVPFDPAHLLVFPRLVLWGANWYADRLPASGGWIVWDKTPRGAKNGFAASHAELAWTNCCSSVRKFSMQWGGEAHGGEPHLHPTQKPVGLMRWVLRQFTEVGDLVLDPYMGSGPVAQACREEGRRYIGIEIEERYCSSAVSHRLSQGLLNLGSGDGRSA
jgi:site-specific DNA-methyltransferase (adenine-specific)